MQGNKLLGMLVVAGLLGFSVSASAHSGTVAARFAKQYGCPKSSITVTKLGASGWSAKGCGVAATYTCIQQYGWRGVVCVLESQEKGRRAERLMIRNLGKVTVKRDAFTEKHIVELRLKVGRLGFYFTGVPDLRADVMKFRIKAITAHRKMDSCRAIELKLGKKRVKLEKSKHQATPHEKMLMETLATSIPLAVVEKMSNTNELMGRVCGHNWKFSENDRKLMQEFVAKFRSLIAADAKASPPSKKSKPQVAPSGIQI